MFILLNYVKFVKRIISYLLIKNNVFKLQRVCQIVEFMKQKHNVNNVEAIIIY